MLLRMAALERIVRGEISLVFRRWRRPTVRTGGSLRTAVGVLRILEVARRGGSGRLQCRSGSGGVRVAGCAAGGPRHA